MSSAAAEEPAKKRVRINEDANTVSSTAAPIYSSTTTILTSDPTLLPAIKAITTYYIDKYMSLSKRKYAKANAMNKLYDPKYVPKSARLNFTVGVSDKASSSDKYEALAASVKTCNDNFEQKQKEKILKAAELEMDVLSNEMKLLFCEAFYEIAAIFYLWKTKSKEVDIKSVHTIVHDTTNFDSSIFQFVFPNDATVQFVKNYNELYTTSIGIVTVENEFNTLSDDLLSQIPMPTTAPAPSPASTITHFYGAQSQLNTTAPASTTTTETTQAATTADTTATANEDVDAEAHYNYDNDYATNNSTENVNNNNNNNNNNDDDEVMKDKNPSILRQHDIKQLLILLKKSFVTTWNNHLNDVEARQLNANFNKYAALRIKSKATDKAAVIVANEPSSTPQIMSELIKKAVSKENEQLQKKLSQLAQQLSRSTITKPKVKSTSKNNGKAKNDTRGETTTRASTPKKSKTKPNNQSISEKKTKTSTTKPKLTPKAGDVNNDTRKNNNKSSKNKKKPKSNEKIINTKRTNSNNNKTRKRV